jgi:hypothetical protein
VGKAVCAPSQRLLPLLINQLGEIGNAHEPRGLLPPKPSAATGHSNVFGQDRNLAS